MQKLSSETIFVTAVDELVGLLCQEDQTQTHCSNSDIQRQG